MRVFVIDPSAAVRLRLATLIAGAGGEVAGEAVDLAVATDLVPVLEPDVVLVEARTPGARLRDLVATAKRQRPTPVVIVLAAIDAPALRHQCLAAGADYILDKADDVHTLVSILRLLGRPACS